jgi:hypothetical protein
VHFVGENDLHADAEDGSGFGPDRQDEGKSEVGSEPECVSLWPNGNCLLGVLALNDAINFDDSCDLVDMDSDFLNVGVRVDILVEFHLSTLQFFLKGPVFSQVLYFILVEHLQCYQVEIQVSVLFGGYQSHHQISFFLDQVDLLKGLVRYFKSEVAGFSQFLVDCWDGLSVVEV